MKSPAKLILANWKMHGSRAMLADFAAEARRHACAAERVLCPPFPYLSEAATLLEGSGVALGAQHCHAAAEGAYTGDVSAAMLKELGCGYVILGHSERRAHYGETEADIAAAATTVIEAGMQPVICIGESLAVREQGRAEAEVADGLREILLHLPEAASLILAYEPVWAIGSGRTPTPQEIAAMHAAIAAEVRRERADCRLRILYGGSVKPDNAAALAEIVGVDGFLVGGSSLRYAAFGAICSAAAEAALAA